MAGKRQRWGQDVHLLSYPMEWKKPRGESEDLALHSASNFVTLDKQLNLFDLWFLYLWNADNNA